MKERRCERCKEPIVHEWQHEFCTYKEDSVPVPVPVPKHLRQRDVVAVEYTPAPKHRPDPRKLLDLRLTRFAGQPPHNPKRHKWVQPPLAHDVAPVGAKPPSSNANTAITPHTHRNGDLLDDSRGSDARKISEG